MSSLISPACSRPTSPAFPRAEQCRAFGLAAVAAELNLQIEMLEPEVAEAVAMGTTALFLAGYGPRGSTCARGAHLSGMILETGYHVIYSGRVGFRGGRPRLAQPSLAATTYSIPPDETLGCSA